MEHEPITLRNLSKTLPHAAALAGSGLETWSTHDWFVGLPASLIAEINQLTHRRILSSGALLHARGEAPEGLCSVVRGGIRIGAVNAAGEEVMLFVFEPGSWLGHLSVFDDGKSPVDAHVPNIR